MRAPFVDPLFSLEILNPTLPLLGREMEMQVLRSVLENVVYTHPHGARAAIVSGETGVGKSRLLEELCMVAGEQGFTVFKSSAYMSGSMFPYLPFIEALRPLVRSSTVEELRRYTGLDEVRGEQQRDSSSVNVSLTGQPLITAFCQLFPELAHRLQITPVQEPLSPDQAKFRLFDAIATLLERVSQERPLLLCIDNLQWADSATLELTMYLTVRLHSSQVALLGATRPPQSASGQAEVSDNPLVTLPTQAGNALKLLFELMQQGFLLLLPLVPLSEVAAEQHIHALLPGVLPEELSQELLTRAGGNPFFLEELVRSLCLNQQLVLRAGVWQMAASAQSGVWPERITLAVRQRLQGLTCRELLQIAALLGHTFPLQPLARVSGQPEVEVLEALEEALRATLIARVAPAPANWTETTDARSEPVSQTPLFAFCQGIVQEVLATEIQTQRRRQLHGAIGAALEEYYGQLAPLHAAELARQYVLSDQQNSALIWSLLAGRDASRQQAHREAISHWRMALTLLDAGVPLSSEQQWPTRAQISLSLGESWFKLGELEQAAHAFHQALDSTQPGVNGPISATDEEPLTRARANRLLADAYRLQGKYELALTHLQAAAHLLASEKQTEITESRPLTRPEPVAWLSSTSPMLRQPPPIDGERTPEDFSRRRVSERLLLLQAEATLDLLLFRFAQAEQTLWQVHQMAAELGDRGSQGFALHLLGWLRGWGKGINEAIRLLTQAHELYIATGDPFHAALGDQSLGTIYQALGETETARRYNQQGFERARRYGVQHILGWLHCNRGIMALTQGDWQESESHLRQALDAAELPGNARIKPLALQGLAMLLSRRGDWPRAEQLFQEAVQAALNTEWYPGVLALYGHFLAVTGCRDAARVQLDRAASLTEPFGYSGDFYIPFLAEGYLHLEDRQPATAYIERIRDLRGFSYYGVAVARILGKVAALQGDWETAEQAFTDGLALCRRSHNGPEEAAILYEQARTALLHNRQASSLSEAKIHELCDGARKLFLHYEMQRSVHLVDTLQEGLRQLAERQQTRDAAPIAPASHLIHADYQLNLSLSRRELEVLRLVAEGRTDREVADALVLSPRTVNRHLSNIFIKLDVPGRAAAVAYAIRQGLVE